jgi:hypothetical protein
LEVGVGLINKPRKIFAAKSEEKGEGPQRATELMITKLLFFTSWFFSFLLQTCKWYYHNDHQVGFRNINIHFRLKVIIISATMFIHDTFHTFPSLM